MRKYIDGGHMYVCDYIELTIEHTYHSKTISTALFTFCKKLQSQTIFQAMGSGKHSVQILKIYVPDYVLSQFQSFGLSIYKLIYEATETWEIS